MTKKEIRKEIRQQNLALSAEERLHISTAICEQIEALPAFATADTVALFYALPDELPTSQMLDRWAQHKRLVLPRVEGEVMQFYEYAPERLATGAFGIAEPAADAILCPPAQIKLIVVPGVAFTHEGARLGRGRGYYDKYLSQNDFSAYKVGVCYAHQLIATLPTEPHDVPMDTVVYR